MIWEPILSEKNSVAAKSILKDIIDIGKLSRDFSKVSLHDNNIAIDILLSYASKYYSSKELKECAILNIEKQFESAEFKGNYGLITGYTGLFWVVYHLNNIGIFKSDKQSSSLFNNRISTILHVEEALNYDYFNGYLGLAIALFENHKIDNTNSFNEIINKISSIAIYEKKFIKWEDHMSKPSFNLTENDSCINLGFAHGMSGIIVILSKIYLRTQNKDCLKLITNSVNWLLSQEKENTFPELTINNNPHVALSKTRLGWCYGDLSVGYAIYLTGLLINNQKYIDHGIRIALNTTIKIGTLGNLVDHTLCHGNIGIAHMYNRLYQYTKIVKFKEQAIYWYQLTFEQTSLSINNIKISTWYDTKSEAQGSFLTGLTGIGLSILSATSNIEPAWDRCLLLS